MRSTRLGQKSVVQDSWIGNVLSRKETNSDYAPVVYGVRTPGFQPGKPSSILGGSTSTFQTVDTSFGLKSRTNP